MRSRSLDRLLAISCLFLLLLQSESAPQAFRRDPGHPQWHHGAFQDVKDNVRSDVRQMLHSRAEVFFLLSIPISIRLLRSVFQDYNVVI